MGTAWRDKTSRLVLMNRQIDGGGWMSARRQRVNVWGSFWHPNKHLAALLAQQHWSEWSGTEVQAQSWTALLWPWRGSSPEPALFLLGSFSTFSNDIILLFMRKSLSGCVSIYMFYLSTLFILPHFWLSIFEMNLKRVLTEKLFCSFILSS